MSINDEHEVYGAKIELGEVIQAGDGVYKVRSLERENVVTPEIKSMEDGTLEVGDRVYFFLFDNGVGAILWKVEG